MGSRFAGRDRGRARCRRSTAGSATPSSRGLGRLFFRTDVSDFHCGLRGFRRDALEKLDLRTTGMEYASEMVVKAALFGLTIREIPVTLRKDGRSRPPHLRTWRDGWRHLRFLLLYSPRWLFLVPGLLLVARSARGSSSGSCRARASRSARRGTSTRCSAAPRWSSSARRPSSSASARRSSAITEGPPPEGSRSSRTLFDRWVTLETGLAASCLALLAGRGARRATSSSAWGAAGFHDLAYGATMRWMIPGVLLLVLGAEGVFGSFLLSLLGVRRR